MQSVFRLPWSSNSPGHKIMEKPFFQKSSSVGFIDVPSRMLTKLKRKRTTSTENDSCNAPSPKKRMIVKTDAPPLVDIIPPDQLPEIPNVRDVPVQAPQSDVTDPCRSDNSLIVESSDVSHFYRSETEVSDLSKEKSSNFMPPNVLSSNVADVESPITPLKCIVEAQFNYEILLKHKELRLIEQELAKCLASLEQLRRCQIIPYPGTEGFTEDLSNCSGPAIEPPSGFVRPEKPSPWGVKDGPYARHYSKWLIPDPKFDPVPPQTRSQGFTTFQDCRSTRASVVDSSVTSKTRSLRGAKLHLQSTDTYASARLDPLLHKRSTDGQWVRLYCADCKHGNFCNTQGFLNHCRIKHNQVFKTHDAAAISCGVPVDVDDDLHTGTMSFDVSSVVMSTVPADFNVPSASGSSLVHPLIKSQLSPLTPSACSLNITNRSEQPLSETATLPVQLSTPNTETPYLSAQIQSKLPASSDIISNFENMVKEYRVPVDTSDLDPSPNSDGDDISMDVHGPEKPQEFSFSLPNSSGLQLSALEGITPSTKPRSLTRPSHLPVCLKHSPKRNAKSTGSSCPPANGFISTASVVDPLSRKHSPVSQATQQCDNDAEIGDVLMDLSPNTLESIPGLVSDHDDDDFEEDDEDDDAGVSAAGSGGFEVQVEAGSDVYEGSVSSSREGFGKSKIADSKGG